MSLPTRAEMIERIATAITEAQVGRLDLLNERRRRSRINARLGAAERVLDTITDGMEEANQLEVLGTWAK